MPDASIREELKNLIEERAWMISDAQIFVWGKCEDRHEQLANDGIGGGNFLVTLGMFAVLNFLSKAYYLLHDDAELWSEEEVRRVKRALRSCPDSHGAVPPFKGAPKRSEKACFIEFADAMDFPFFLGEEDMPQSDRRQIFERMWDSYRNKLAHMAMPGQAISSVGDYAGRPYSEVRQMLDGNTQPAFVESNGAYLPITDLLSRDIRKWVDWLKTEVDYGGFSDRRIRAAIDWIRS
jgi:hypothetical protein